MGHMNLLILPNISFMVSTFTLVLTLKILFKFGAFQTISVLIVKF